MSRPQLFRRLILLLVLATAESARAQEIPVSPQLVRATKGPDPIRIRLTSGRVVDLRAHTMDGPTLRGIPQGAHLPEEFPLTEVDQVWRRGGSARTGALIGGAAGFIAGAVGGAAAAEFCGFGDCPYPTTSEQLTWGAGGALVGGLIGAGLGAAIAAPIRRWHTAYRRPVTVAPLVGPSRIGLTVAW